MDSREEVTLDEQETPAPPAQPRRSGRLPTSRAHACAAASPGPRASIDPLLKKVRGYNPKADLKEIQRAYAVAEASHEGQKRMSGEDFIEHPSRSRRSWRTCTWTRRRSRPRSCTTRSRTRTSRSTTIEEEFGEEVARIVDGLTKLERIEFQHPRAGAGRERPQDDRGDGGRHPRAADQARRPPAQHADAGVLHPRSSGASPPRRWRSTRRSHIAWVSRR